MIPHLLLGFTAVLITYGSLYPFDFSPVAPEAMRRLFADWQLMGSRGDIVGNVILFVPWGLVGLFSFGERLGRLASEHPAADRHRPVAGKLAGDHCRPPCFPLDVACAARGNDHR